MIKYMYNIYAGGQSSPLPVKTAVAALLLILWQTWKSSANIELHSNINWSDVKNKNFQLGLEIYLDKKFL